MKKVVEQIIAEKKPAKSTKPEVTKVIEVAADMVIKMIEEHLPHQQEEDRR